MKAVFQQSSHSDYLDRPGEVYHFPNRNYLSVAARTVGDWVLFYEGRRGDARGYYAVQRVERITADPTDPAMSFAIMDRGSLLEFPNAVPRSRPDGSRWESGLAVMGGNNTSAVREISDADFAAIVDEGLRESQDPDSLPRQAVPSPAEPPGFNDAPAPFLGPVTDRARMLTSRAVRDAAFARSVKRAYHGRCAISGLALRNGGGRAEVDAAHIRAVEDGGPDTVRNGLSLSGTVHWMFDRGLIAVDDDHSILIARDSIAGEVVDRLVVPDRRLILPARPGDAPHPAFLRWHREHRFKG